MKEKNILLFTGAGFCVPFDMPTTIGFNKVIDANCNDEFGIILKNFLVDRFYDVEDLLSTLEFFTTRNSLLKHSINHHTYQQANMNAAIHQVRTSFQHFQQSAKSIIFELKKSVFNILEDYNKITALDQYKDLIIELKEYFPECNLSFFTTNYDLSFEDSQDDLEEVFKKYNIEDVDFGFTNKNQKYFFDEKKKYNWNSQVIEYKKLHGSLDWTLKSQRCIKSGSVIEPSDPTKILLLYPGFKGSPNDEPYRSLHDQLLERLLSADYAIVVGFAFRDEFINSIFETAMRINKNIEIYCVNPANIEALPNESMIKLFTKKYKSQFFHKQQKIESDRIPGSKVLDMNSLLSF